MKPRTMKRPAKLQWPHWRKAFTCPGCHRMSERIFSGAVAMPELFCSDDCRKKVHAFRDERIRKRQQQPDPLAAIDHATPCEEAAAMEVKPCAACAEKDARIKQLESAYDLQYGLREQWQRNTEAAEARATAAERERDQLRGAMEADDERLRDAERRVYSDPDKTFGCDAADHLAELVLHLRAKLSAAEKERDRWKANDAASTEVIATTTIAWNEALAKLAAAERREAEKDKRIAMVLASLRIDRDQTHDGNAVYGPYIGQLEALASPSTPSPLANLDAHALTVALSTPSPAPAAEGCLPRYVRDLEAQQPPSPDAQAKTGEQTCETHGHLYGPMRVCIFCDAPSPVPASEPKDTP